MFPLIRLLLLVCLLQLDPSAAFGSAIVLLSVQTNTAATGVAMTHLDHAETEYSLVNNNKQQPQPLLPVKDHVCKLCGGQFSTRNALFRHIYSTHSNQQETLERHSMMVHVGGNTTDLTQKLLKLLAFPEIIGTTQASVAKARKPALGDVHPTMAAQDVWIVNFLAPNDWEDCLKLPETIFEPNNNNNDDLHLLRIHGWRNLGDESTLHAEHSATQHTFRYLLPVAWLPHSDAIIDWYKHGQPRPPLSILKRLKHVLRSFESHHVKRRESHRFGALAHKERQCFHNFANPELAGAISPHSDVVLRAVDRGRFLNVIEDSCGRYFVICEFKGDNFLQQQVQRMVGTAVAVVHGWLPDNFIEISMDRTKIIETVLAPSNFLFRAGVRFHFAEQYYNGQTLLRAEGVHRLHNEDPVEWMQQQVLASSANGEAFITEWLDNVQTTIAPRIREQLLQEQALPTTAAPLSKLNEPSAIFLPVLELLREIVRNKQWPSTSAARSSVLQTSATQGGSFTVVNQERFDLSGLEQLPQANSLFPNLSHAVFELEGALCMERSNNSTVRPPSSHCAVNCNAQFTPHVDSGRGLGQSLSMIVGLGDYVGGELRVEHKQHDIRYTAVEFDGWKLRHWTLPFLGERFSLVWFTPEGMIAKQ